MKRIAVLTLSLLLVAGIASARGGANGPGYQHDGPYGAPGWGPGGSTAIVAPDGTIFVTRIVTDSATNTASVQIIAVTPAGATLWTRTLTDGRGPLVLSGANLLLVNDSSTPAAVSSTITALATASGSVAWTANVDGWITDLEPFSGGTYVIAVTPSLNRDGTATRSLVAISHSGATLWTMTL